MDPIYTNIAALTVAVIFYVYRAYAQVLARRQRLVRERVAYMLWVMADQVESNQEALSA